jgi:hypothetical protein
MTESETGNPFPLLSYVWTVPLVEVTTTVKDEIEEVIGRLEMKE